MIEDAIERGDQGFRGGWLDAKRVTELTGVTGSGFASLIDEIKYVRIGVAFKTVDGVNEERTVYHTNPNANIADFWTNNPIASQRVRLIEEAIERGDQGFRGGWLCNKKISELTGAKKKSLSQIINDMGYQHLGMARKRFNNSRCEMNVYHTDPSADPSDFWKANGYE